MNIKHILAALCVAAISSCALAAPAAPVSLSPDGGTVYVQGNASPTYRMTPLEVENINGSFRLADGRMLKLSNDSRRVYAEMNGKREELVAVSPTDFVTRRTGMQVAFDQMPFANKVTLTTHP